MFFWGINFIIIMRRKTAPSVSDDAVLFSEILYVVLLFDKPIITYNLAVDQVISRKFTKEKGYARKKRKKNSQVSRKNL